MSTPDPEDLELTFDGGGVTAGADLIFDGGTVTLDTP